MSRQAAAARTDPYELGAASPALTRERILHAAARLFYRRGIRAVNVDTVAAEAGLTKVTLYKHLHSKDELVAACLHMLDDRFFGWFVREVSARSQDPAARLLAVFDVLDHWFRRESFRGCAFINTTVELADPGHPAHQAVLAHKARTRDYFHELAEAAHLPDPAAVSDQWMLLSEGAIITALVEDDRDAARRARRAAAALLAAAGAGPGQASS